MIAALRYWFGLQWLTGPIFAKELRVSSRRRRNYALRTAYIVLLSLFIGLVWLAEVRTGGSLVYRVSRMSEAGQIIAMTIAYFQFITAQFIAVVSCSTAVSDEIYHRTLGVLMTTPITALQIVIGKLLSRLLQVFLLLAISLPLLTLVRIFGGLPWSYLIATFCITVTATLVAGAVSLLFSITSRRAYAVIIRAALTLIGAYFFIPMVLVFAAITSGGPDTELLVAIGYINPLFAMQLLTMDIFGAGVGSAAFYWPIHCLVMLALAGGLLALAVALVRKAALRQIGGEGDNEPAPVPPTPPLSDPPAALPATLPTTGAQVAATAVASPAPPAIPAVKPPVVLRPVKDPPMLWKELRQPLMGKKGVGRHVAAAILGLLLIGSYAMIASELDNEEVHIGYVALFTIVGLITTIVVPATTIASEKESQAWPLLLTTGLSNRDIVQGKFWGAIRRSLFSWTPLFAHVLLFTVLRLFHPVALLQLALAAVVPLGFFTTTGLYFSSRFRKVNAAVTANIILALALLIVLPTCMGWASEIFLDDDVVEATVVPHPIVQVVVITEATAGDNNAREPLHDLDYSWPLWDDIGWLATFGILLSSAVGAAPVALPFYTATLHNIRRRIF